MNALSRTRLIPRCTDGGVAAEFRWAAFPFVVVAIANLIGIVVHAGPDFFYFMWAGVVAIHPFWLVVGVRRSFLYFLAITLPMHLVAGWATILSWHATDVPVWDLSGVGMVFLWMLTIPTGLVVTGVVSLLELLLDLRKRRLNGRK